VIDSLNGFVMEYGGILPFFGLDPRDFGFLKRGYGELKLFDGQNVQVMVDDAILIQL
jgi:hypothetical protein